MQTVWLWQFYTTWNVGKLTLVFVLSHYLKSFSIPNSSSNIGMVLFFNYSRDVILRGTTTRIAIAIHSLNSYVDVAISISIVGTYSNDNWFQYNYLTLRNRRTFVISRDQTSNLNSLFINIGSLGNHFDIDLYVRRLNTDIMPPLMVALNLWKLDGATFFLFFFFVYPAGRFIKILYACKLVCSTNDSNARKRRIKAPQNSMNTHTAIF